MRLLSLTFSLQTSAVAGGRVVNLELTDADGNLLFITSDASGQAASLTQTYIVSPDLNSGLTQQGGNHFLTFLHSYLEAGWIVKVTVSGEQAADQLSAVVLLTETLPVGQGGLDRTVS